MLPPSQRSALVPSVLALTLARAPAASLRNAPSEQVRWLVGTTFVSREVVKVFVVLLMTVVVVVVMVVLVDARSMAAVVMA